MTVTTSIPVQRAGPGEHMCSFPAGDAERRTLSLAFVRSGLSVGDRVLYATEDAPSDVARALDATGADGSAALARGQLTVVRFPDVYANGARFDPGTASRELRRRAVTALGSGYPGVHAVGDMGWFARAGVPLVELVEWEERCTALWKELGAVALCQYDRGLFGADARAAVAGPHTAVGGDDGSAPMAWFTPVSAPWGARLSGEIDAHNAEAFARLLRARASRARRGPARRRGPHVHRPPGRAGARGGG